MVGATVHPVRSMKSNQSGGDHAVAALLVACGAVLWFGAWLLAAIAILSLALALAAWRPVGATWAIGAALPTVTHPVAIGGARVSLLELAILCAFAGYLTNSAFGMMRGDQRLRTSIDWSLAGPLLAGCALITSGVLSLAFQPDVAHRAEALRVFRWTLVESVMVFLVAHHAIRRRGARSLFWSLVIPAVIVAFVSLLLLLKEPRRFEGDGVPRAIGPYLHPNNLALYLERVFVLLCAAIVAGGVRLTRISALAGMTIGLALLATLSRGMIPAVVAGLVLAAWLVGNRGLIAAGGLAMMAGSVALGLAVQQRSRGGSLQDFLGERRYVWRAAWQMIRDFPISGIGMDQFLYQHAPRYIAPEAWTERYLSHPHNLVLDAWLSLGVAGLIMLLLAIAMLGRAIVDPALRIKGPFAAAAIAVLLTGLVHGLVDNGYFLPDLAAMTWLFVAFVVSGAELSCSGGLEPER